MKWEQHEPLIWATAAIVVTLIACTWSINQQIQDSASEVRGEAITHISEQLGDIDMHTDSIAKQMESSDR